MRILAKITEVITSGILSDIVEDNLKGAILGIIKLQNERGDLKDCQIARDAGKVISIRLTSAINQAIIAQKPYGQEIIPCFYLLVCIFRYLVPDLSDNH